MDKFVNLLESQIKKSIKKDLLHTKFVFKILITKIYMLNSQLVDLRKRVFYVIFFIYIKID